ncbi:guanine nucleotide exchange factor [Spinellus fusiger]|nr:guanine nucleotide exchange factor [Spinellus fusiger]
MALEYYNEIKNKDKNEQCRMFETLQNRISTISSYDKHQLVQYLLKDLNTNLAMPIWSMQVTTFALQTMKLLGREPDTATLLYTENGMITLCHYAGVSATPPLDTPCSCEALKCIANCIHLDPNTKKWLESLGIMDTCCQLLHLPDLSMDSQFLTCRILFFMTVHRNDLVQKLIQLGIGKCIAKVSAHNVRQIGYEPEITASPIHPTSVLSEALKLLFNIMLVDGRTQSNLIHESTITASVSIAEHFQECLGPIFDILLFFPCPQPLPLVPPLSHAIHALMQFPFAVIEAEWKKRAQMSPEQNHEPKRIAETLVTLLDQSIRYLIPNNDPDQVNHASTIDATLSPLFLVLRSLAKGNQELKQLLVTMVLPQDSDRIQPVHQGTRLPAYLIRLMTCALLPQTRDAVSEMVWVLCNEQADLFTHHVGYGNAIGFLVNKGIPVAAEDSGLGDSVTNPITGQYLEEEDQGPSLADMTYEEKEREAERLFVLFERLKKTGVVNVENPIAKAMRENQDRLEEISSDEETS